MLALTPLVSHADTVTTIGNLSGSNNPLTMVPTIPTPGTQQTVFNAYNGGSYNYTISTLYVGTSGIFSATSATTLHQNTTWFLTGPFSPGPSPSTPLSNFFAGTYSGGATVGGKYVANFSNLSLTAGQQYSVLVAFNNGSSTITDSYSITVDGLGCINFGPTNMCGAKFVAVSNSVTGGVAATLDNLLTSGTLSGNMAAAVNVMAALPDDQRATAEKRLTPGANNAQGQTAFQSMNVGLSSVTRRLEGIRNAGALAWADPDTKNFTLAGAGPMNGLLDAKQLRLGAWGRVLGGHANQSAMDGFAGYKADIWGLSFGQDTRLESGTIVGAAATYTVSNAQQQDFLSGSGNSVKNYQLTAYGSRDLGHYYVDGEMSYGQQKYQTHRDTQVTGVASANFDGRIWAARVGIGMPILFKDAITVTPTASLEVQRLRQDGYSEAGADVLSLTVNSASASRVRSSLGTRVAIDDQWGSVNVRPSLHAQWLHDFKNDGIETTAAFVGGGGAFVTPGQKIARDSANLGGSLMFTVAKNVAMSMAYDVDIAKGYRNQTAQIVGKMWF
jgi:outer membrane autotransporter protein